MNSSVVRALETAPVVLDGGLATALEARGHDLSSELWSARLLLDQPHEIAAVHRDYFAAGAQVAITSSYQVSFEGFAKLGLDATQTVAALRRSVDLAAAARDQAVERSGDGVPRWVAASVGPYGAALADGSEYRGDYGLSVAQLRRWHHPRLEALLEAGADIVALETIPCLSEAEALLAEVAGTGSRVWFSLTCAGDSTRAGEPVAQAFAMARDVPEVVAVGVNCCRPTDVAALVASAVAVSGKPAVAYPNSGEAWDARSRTWSGPSSFDADLVRGWAAAGARLVGGCCRVGPAAITDVALALRSGRADDLPPDRGREGRRRPPEQVAEDL